MPPCTPAPLLLGLLVAPACAQAQGVVRHPIPNSSFPISQAVEVPAGKATVYPSGVVPPVADEAVPRGSAAAYGGTRTQAAGVLRLIERDLQRLDLSMGEVIKMTVFLVGDPAQGNRMDFAGFMAAYTERFGTQAQPNLPVRSVVQVAALANPHDLVEAEVTAVRP